MISVILAGGKGLRLWPESRRLRPKQLCKLVQDKTMLDQTLDRLMEAGTQKIIIITNTQQLTAITELVKLRSDSDIIEILSEPEGKNTAPAVGLALSKCLQESADAVMGIFPADHHILDNESFKHSIQQAVLAARSGHVATIGIKPDRPETGYGYIEKSKWEIGEIPGVFKVNSFCEKPDLDTAKLYKNSGKHLWNSGIYIAQVQTLAEEFLSYLPELYQHISSGYDEYLKSYSHLPSISLDYGIAEKSDRLAIVGGDFGWSDLGNWNALAELYENDDKNNRHNGKDVVLLDSKNCLVKQEDKTVVVFGGEDLLVVESDGVILVSHREKCQNLRELVNFLQENRRDDLL